MHDVFVSYATPDKEVADAIVHHMESIGIRCFIAPRDMRVGPEWKAQLVAGIRGSKVFALVLSNSSNGSEPVRNEIFVAVSAALIIIPFKIQEVELHDSLVFDLEKRQWLNAITPPLALRIQELGSHVCAILNVTSSGLFQQPEEGHRRRPSTSESKLQNRSWLWWALCLMAICFAIYEMRPKQQPPSAVKSVLEKSLTVTERMTLEGNSLSMKFATIPNVPNGLHVLGCIHETRSKDFARFVADGNKRSGDGADEWRLYRYQGFPAGRGEHEIAENSNHPVCNVSLEDAKEFCSWLTAKERRVRLIGANDTYRLPTDHEWSLMVEIGDQEDPNATPASKSDSAKLLGVYPWGSSYPPAGDTKAGNFADETAHAKGTDSGLYIRGYDDGYATTAPVMSFSPNRLGFFDLGGNVWEWCDDAYDTASSYRVMRGGSWYLDTESRLLSSRRDLGIPPREHRGNLGFRCVLEVSGG